MNLLEKLTALKGVFLDMLLRKAGVHPMFIDELKARGAAMSDPFRKKKLNELKTGEPKEGEGEDMPDDDEPETFGPKYQERDGVKIYGVIVDEDWAWIMRWFGIEATSAESVRADIKNKVKGKTCTLYIDSFGGSVIEAGKIRSALDEWRAAEKGRSVVSRVEGAAISAAAAIMVIGDNISADSQSLIGLHVPLLDTFSSSATTHRKAAEMLDSILDAECKLFARRMKMRANAIAAKMQAGLDEVWWMAAHEAQKAGLVDSVIGLDGGEDDDEDTPPDENPDGDPDADPAPEGDGDEGGGDNDDKDDPSMKGGENDPSGEPPVETPETESDVDVNRRRVRARL